MNDESSNDEIINIYNLLKTLDIEDAFIDYTKFAPFNFKNLYYLEISPFNLLLEEPCDYKNECFYKKEPLVCCKNHQTIDRFIMSGQEIPKYLCKYERTWKLLNGYPMRCQNIHCWFSHLSGRRQIINYIANST